MYLNAIKCPHCKDTVYSRVREDLRHCSCGYVWISGGTISLNIGCLDEEVTSFKVQVDTNFTDLFTDWNRGIDKLGIIKEK